MVTQDTCKSNQNHPGHSEKAPLAQTRSSVLADMKAIDELALFGMLDLVGRWMQPGSARWTTADLVERLGVAPRHHWLIERWLTELAVYGLIDGDKVGWNCSYRPSRKQLRTIRTDMAQAASRLGYGPLFVQTLLESLRRSTELFRDEITIQSLFFPDGTIEFAKAIYETNAISRYLNTAAAEAIAALENRPIRVLELGAGIGGTTAAVAESDAAIDHYAYTDLSSWFLELGQQRFAEQLPISTHLLNIDEDFSHQLSGTGRPDQYDVVLAANVAHNAPDIGALLYRIRDVLRPGGYLMLIEMVEERPQALISMSYAISLPASYADPAILDSGSGLRRYDERRGSDRTLLAESEWQAHLAAANFDVRTLLPEPAHPLHPTSQRLFTAQMAS